MKHPHHRSRRTVLKGLGATLSLPFLASLPRTAWAENPGIAGSDPGKPPRRWAMVTFANGVHPENWQIAGAGADMQLSSVLEPLAPFKEHLLFLQNLHVYNSTSPGHWPLFSNFLSGAQLERNGVPTNDVSLDQFMMQRIGHHTAVPGLTMGIEHADHAFWNTMSWSSPTTPVSPEIHPGVVFDRLFDVTRLEQHRSVLDVVLQQSNRLRDDLALCDQRKLDEFSESVRSVERRLQRAAEDERLEGAWRPSLTEPDMPRPPDERPSDLREHQQLMIDLLVLAFRMDKTRIATLLLECETSKQKFDFLDGVSGMPMHAISHHGGKEGHKEQYRLVNRYHFERIADLAAQMQAIEEGDGTTLLDNTMLLAGSNMMDGHIHDGRRLPIVVIGGRACGIRSGRVLEFAGEENELLCNLHLSFLHHMGIAADSFGDSHHAIDLT